jgi:hypothetical protein
VQTVSDRASSANWTGQIVTHGGRFLDPGVLFRTVRAVGDPFWLRGVEATVEGVLVDVEGRPALKLPGSGGEILPLAPLEHKVQWDVRQNRVEAMTDMERGAFERLGAERPQHGTRVRIVGPLMPGDGGRPPRLEVRQFDWRPEPSTRQAPAVGHPSRVTGTRAKAGGRAKPRG